MSNRIPLINYIVSHHTSLSNIDLIKEIWMIPDRTVATSKQITSDGLEFKITCLGGLYKDKLFVYEDMFYSVVSFERIGDRSGEYRVYKVIGADTGIIYNPKELNPLCTPQDRFTLHPGEIANFSSSKSIDTNIGIFVANYLFLVYAFGDIISYLNEELTTSKLEKKIDPFLLDGTISVKQAKKYADSLTLFGSSPEIICPNISEKTITIPPEITALRTKLIEENKEALLNGDSSIMSSVEKQLINVYKDYLKGDPSLHFLLKKKYYDITLKKLFLTHGMVETFGSPGKFTFVENPLASGWKQDDLPTIFNEVRQGSFARAVETQNGGVIAKLILRVLQDTRITEDDCHTKRGEHIRGTDLILSDFMWNYVIEPNGDNTLIDDETVKSLVGKDLIVRTPGYCQSTTGFCAKCFGKLFESLGQKSLAPVFNDFARNQTVNSLKSMHGKSHSTVDVSDINRYIVV